MSMMFTERLMKILVESEVWNLNYLLDNQLLVGKLKLTKNTIQASSIPHGYTKVNLDKIGQSINYLPLMQIGLTELM